MDTIATSARRDAAMSFALRAGLFRSARNDMRGALRGRSRKDESALARYIKEIGRGRHAAGDLSREDAQALFAEMLAGGVPDLHLGAILIALRVKGESLDELAGFAAACEAGYTQIPPFVARPSPRSGHNLSRQPFVPSLSKDEHPVPVVIPAYNGARQRPNLVPLLALALARDGIPVLVHGRT